MASTYTYVTITRVSPRRGLASGGTAVTITGFGFDFATGAVTFDGSPATNVVIVSNTQITCTTPQHASGLVDVAVAGVGTGTGLFTYELPSIIRLPPPPVSEPISPMGSLEKNAPALVRWFNTVKKTIEGQFSPEIFAEQIQGPLTVDQIPTLPWTKVDPAGSSLADLETRSASDLSSGVVANARGGTGRSNAYSFAPGSFSVPTGTYALHLSRLELTGSERVTIYGTGRLGIL